MLQILKLKTSIAFTLFASSAYAENWSAQFKPYELQAAPDLPAVATAFEWALNVVILILSGVLIASATNYKRKGDIAKSICSFVGALIIAIARFMAPDLIH